MTTRTKQLAEIILDDNHDHNTEDRRNALARAITLVESRAIDKRDQADLLLGYLAKSADMRKQRCEGEDDDSDLLEGKDGDSSHIASSFRVGITGPPGAGKSTFIEKLGLHILGEDEDGKCTRLKLSSDSNFAMKKDKSDDTHSSSSYFPPKMAVVCIDPSSSRTGGSILGDKTRMTELSRHSRAFVRPSPSGGTLGGVTDYTNDVVMLYQAADYGLVLVETVGLGQSEIEVDKTVDMLILVVPPGGGDSLQGVKKGIIEVADLLVVNKADEDFLDPARRTATDYRGALQFQQRKVLSWQPPVLLASAHTGHGVAEVWEQICRYRNQMTTSGELIRKRKWQAQQWMWKHIQDLIASRTRNDPILKKKAETMEKALESGVLPPRVAASEILGTILIGENVDKDRKMR